MKNAIIKVIASINFISLIVLMLGIDSFQSWKPFAVLFVNMSVLDILAYANGWSRRWGKWQ